MSTQLTVKPNAEAIERVVVGGDLSKLSADERLSYYRMICESVGLNPLTKPLEYITLNGKLTLYARKDCTDQLRRNNQVSITIVARETTEGCYVVTARATLPNGRTDESIGAVAIENLKGEARANATMKAETKAKRRVTLSICGLGMLDETEIETIPSAKPEVERIKEPIRVPSPAIHAAQAERAAEQTGAEGAEETSGTSAPAREPGSDDDLDAPIDLAQQRALHRAFRDAIPREDDKKHAEIWMRRWLENRGYTDERGRGSTKRIPVGLFDEVLKEAQAVAATLRA